MVKIKYYFFLIGEQKLLQALEDSRVLFIGINATTCEVAKNLILPGIGHITLLDDKKISANDVMSNFFLSSHMVGQSKTSAYEWLSELNQGVKE